MGQAWGPPGQGVEVCGHQLRLPIGIHPIGSWAQDHNPYLKGPSPVTLGPRKAGAHG